VGGGTSRILGLPGTSKMENDFNARLMGAAPAPILSARDIMSRYADLEKTDLLGLKLPERIAFEESTGRSILRMGTALGGTLGTYAALTAASPFTPWLTVPLAAGGAVSTYSFWNQAGGKLTDWVSGEQPGELVGDAARNYVKAAMAFKGGGGVLSESKKRELLNVLNKNEEFRDITRKTTYGGSTGILGATQSVELSNSIQRISQQTGLKTEEVAGGMMATGFRENMTGAYSLPPISKEEASKAIQAQYSKLFKGIDISGISLASPETTSVIAEIISAAGSGSRDNPGFTRARNKLVELFGGGKPGAEKAQQFIDNYDYTTDRGSYIEKRGFWRWLGDTSGITSVPDTTKQKDELHAAVSAYRNYESVDLFNKRFRSARVVAKDILEKFSPKDVKDITEQLGPEGGMTIFGLLGTEDKDVRDTLSKQDSRMAQAYAFQELMSLSPEEVQKLSATDLRARVESSMQKLSGRENAKSSFTDKDWEELKKLTAGEGGIQTAVRGAQVASLQGEALEKAADKVDQQNIATLFQQSVTVLSALEKKLAK